MDRNPSPATAGSRDTLHRLFSTPEKKHQLKPALDALEEENYKSSQKEDERREAITIAPHHKAEKENIVYNNPEDSRALPRPPASRQQLRSNGNPTGLEERPRGRLGVLGRRRGSFALIWKRRAIRRRGGRRETAKTREQTTK